MLSNTIRAAVVGFSGKSLANEFGKKDGILVNNVGPAFPPRQPTGRKNRRGARPLPRQDGAEIFDGWATDAPLKRLGEPRGVAETIVWLASERASTLPAKPYW